MLALRETQRSYNWQLPVVNMCSCRVLRFIFLFASLLRLLWEAILKAYVQQSIWLGKRSSPACCQCAGKSIVKPFCLVPMAHVVVVWAHGLVLFFYMTFLNLSPSLFGEKELPSCDLHPVTSVLPSEVTQSRSHLCKERLLSVRVNDQLNLVWPLTWFPRETKANLRLALLPVFCTCAFLPTRWQTLTAYWEREDTVSQSHFQTQWTYCKCSFPVDCRYLKCHCQPIDKPCILVGSDFMLEINSRLQ
jgi:hypothetical protein